MRSSVRPDIKGRTRKIRRSAGIKDPERCENPGSEEMILISLTVLNSGGQKESLYLTIGVVDSWSDVEKLSVCTQFP